MEVREHLVDLLGALPYVLAVAFMGWVMFRIAGALGLVGPV